MKKVIKASIEPISGKEAYEALNDIAARLSYTLSTSGADPKHDIDAHFDDRVLGELLKARRAIRKMIQ